MIFPLDLVEERKYFSITSFQYHSLYRIFHYPRADFACVGLQGILIEQSPVTWRSPVASQVHSSMSTQESIDRIFVPQAKLINRFYLLRLSKYVPSLKQKNRTPTTCLICSKYFAEHDHIQSCSRFHQYHQNEERDRRLEFNFTTIRKNTILL